MRLIVNLLLYCGIYTTIATGWRLYEIHKYGEEKPSGRDTEIALWAALIIYTIICLIS